MTRDSAGLQHSHTIGRDPSLRYGRLAVGTVAAG